MADIFSYPRFRWPEATRDRSMWRFRDRLPVEGATPAVTLGEGGTPLSRSRLLEDVDLYWKEEARNPTGSHKDRALSLAVTHAKQVGARAIAVVSAGSTGLSAAAYAARAGLPSLTLTGRGAPAERIHPVFSFGSRLIATDAGIDDTIAALGALSGRGGLYVASTTVASNPVQAEACRTIAYEIVEDLGAAPDWLVLPVGGGGTIASVARGFDELAAAGLIDRLPRLAAVVPRAYDALATAHRSGIADAETFAALPYRDDVDTVLTKLSHAHPPDGLAALAALRASNGVVLAFSDEEAVAAVGRIGAADGLYLEPSSAIVLPALKELVREGAIARGATVVGLACGSGFRETFVVAARRPARIEEVALSRLPDALGL